MRSDFTFVPPPADRTVSGRRGSALPLAFVVAALILATPSVATWPTDPNVNLPIATNLFTHQAPQIAPDGAGGAIIVWEDIRPIPNSAAGDIYAQRVSGAGDLLWPIDGIAVGRLTEDEGGPRRPQVVADSDFGAIVAWEDNRSGTNWDIYAQRVNVFAERLWTHDGIPISLADSDQVEIDITPDGAGGAILTWVDFRSGSSSDIYAQRVDAQGNVLWAVDGVGVCTASGNQRRSQLVSDGAGGAIIVWEDGRSGSTTDIYAQRIDAGGATMWTTDGTAVCTAVNWQDFPKLVMDGAGGAVVVWGDWRPVDAPNIYAQRIDGNGNTLWTVNGVAVCTAPDTQNRPSILADGESGAFVCWPDARAGNGDIYAQRVDSLGNALWTTNGIAVSTAIWVQEEPEIVSDGEGGAIIAWRDSRNDGVSTDIYAQRLDLNGNALWTPNGVAVSTAPNFQYLLELVPDSQGGAIITWEDRRQGGAPADPHIYAQRVDSAGGLTTPTGIPSGAASRSAALRLLPNAPNPFGEGTLLSFELVEAAEVTIDVFDVTGRRVSMIHLGRRGRGFNQYLFDGRDDTGAMLPSGVYFAKVSVGSVSQAQKLIVTR